VEATTSSPKSLYRVQGTARTRRPVSLPLAPLPELKTNRKPGRTALGAGCRPRRSQLEDGFDQARRVPEASSRDRRNVCAPAINPYELFRHIGTEFITRPPTNLGAWRSDDPVNRTSKEFHRSSSALIPAAENRQTGDGLVDTQGRSMKTTTQLARRWTLRRAWWSMAFWSEDPQPKSLLGGRARKRNACRSYVHHRARQLQLQTSGPLTPTFGLLSPRQELQARNLVDCSSYLTGLSP